MGKTRKDRPDSRRGAAPRTEGQGVTRLAASQAGEASRVLARAFREDPVALYLFPEDARRARLSSWYLGSAARYCLSCGEVYATYATGDLAGVAAWLPPDETGMTNYWQMLRSGMLFAPLKLGPAAFSRLMALRAYTEASHKRWAPGRHWYLFVLGVDPADQGRGLGGALIEPGLARADADGLPCYLETQYERNVTFYGRHGFEVVETGVVPNGGPRFWSMLRTPRA